MKERRRAIASGGELERQTSPYEELVRGGFIEPDGSLTMDTKCMLSQPVRDEEHANFYRPFAWLQPDHHDRMQSTVANLIATLTPELSMPGRRMSVLDRLQNNNGRPIPIGSSVVTYDIYNKKLYLCDDDRIARTLHGIRDCMAGEPQKKEARTPLDYAKGLGYVTVGSSALAAGTHAWLGPMPALFAAGIGALGGIVASEYPRKSRLRPERLATMGQLIRQATKHGNEVRTVKASGTPLFVPTEKSAYANKFMMWDSEVARNGKLKSVDRPMTATEQSELNKNSFEYYWKEVLGVTKTLDIPSIHSITRRWDSGLKITEPVLMAYILSDDTYRDVWGEVLDLIRDREGYERRLLQTKGSRKLSDDSTVVYTNFDIKPNPELRKIFTEYQARWLNILNNLRLPKEQHRTFNEWNKIEEFLITITEEDASHPARRGVKEELWRAYNSGKVEQTPENLQLFASAVYTFTAAADESDPDWHGLYKEIWDDGGEVLGLMTPKDFEARYFSI